ncbi:hypothetical protein D3C84_282870 [compost metagenome]
MGILLTFMFLWNMLGALIGIPALSYFLLSGPKGLAAASPQAKEEPSSPDAAKVTPNQMAASVDVG